MKEHDLKKYSIHFVGEKNQSKNEGGKIYNSLIKSKRIKNKIMTFSMQHMPQQSKWKTGVTNKRLFLFNS